jgi:hypothetical protein
MKLVKGMTFINGNSKKAITITNIIGDTVEYNWTHVPEKIPYNCSITQFNEWIQRVDAKLI